jgi:hypothetical protein
MSFGIPEIHHATRPPRFHDDVTKRPRYVMDSIKVILPDGREVKGFVNVQPSNARFWFEVEGEWYSGPVFGRTLGPHPHRGLLGGNGTADLRKFVKVCYRCNQVIKESEHYVGPDQMGSCRHARCNLPELRGGGFDRP